MAGFTSGATYAGSDDHPYICITLTTGETRERLLHDLQPADDMTQNKGDLWKIPISSFGFRNPCVTKNCISRVMLRAQPIPNGNDGWKIESIMTVIKLGGSYCLLTADIGVNRWVDADSDASRKIFYLRKV